MRYFVVIFLLSAVFSSCSPNNVTNDASVEPYFAQQQVQGCFGLYNNASNQFTVYNLARFKDSAYLPAQTFDIITSLIGLETGVIRDEKMSIDSLTPPGGDNATAFESASMKQALQKNIAGYFTNIATQLGRDTLQFYVDSLAYGARYVKPQIKSPTQFWQDNSVQITADEQMGLIKKLYFDQLPFQKRSQRIVKESLQTEKNSNYTLVYKTGAGKTEKGNLVWVLGWIEENRHPYFFSMNFNGQSASGEQAPVMLTNILKHLGFMQGRM